LSGVLYLLNLLLTVSVAPRERPGEVPFAEAVTGPEHAPAILDRWRPWLAFAAVLILIAYGPTLAHLLAATPFNVPARRVW